MRTVVVGGSGFIGSRLTQVLLAQGHSVVVVDTRPPDNPRAEFVQSDVRDESALGAAIAPGVDSVFNLAAAHRDDVRPASLYHEINVAGMRNIAAACTRAGVRKIVFTSTVACYGLDADNPDENAPLAPFNEYARSKLEAEEVLRDWARTPGNQAIVVRPSVVFGEGNRGNVYNLLQQIRRRTFAMVGDGSNRKSMAYVGNVAEFLAWAHDNVEGSAIFNYADKPDLTTREIVATARSMMGLPGPPPRVPYALAVSLGQACDIVSTLTRVSLPFSKIRVIKFCADTTIDAGKAHASGFTARYSLEQALRQTIQSEFARTGTAAANEQGRLRL